ncbi:LLM class flavin-dependent oxidoreductase, partial [Mycobacterium sp. ITM-2017-0098]
MTFRSRSAVPPFRFGLLDGIVNTRISPTLLPSASMLTASATGA